MEDYLSWHEKDKKTLKKIHLSDYWSVRIDEKNRLVFRIVGDCIEIYQCATHYGDK